MTTRHNLQALGINRAPVSQDEMLEAIKRIPIQPANPYGIRFGNEPKQERKLTVDEIITMIGTAGAVKINFIPQMLESVAMMYASKFVDYAVGHRLSDFKKHTRLMREAVQGYRDNLRKHYGDSAYRAYEMYSRQYLDYAGLDIYKMQLQLRVEAVNAIPGKDPDVAAMINAITVFVTCAREYDDEMDKMLSGLLKAPVHQNGNFYLECLKALCVDLAEVYGFRLDVSPTMRTWVKILTNRASSLADKLLAEQNVT